jgi:adenylate kinase family enzyme
MGQYFSTSGEEYEHIGTSYWIKYIQNRIKNNKNFMCVIVGQTGSGKSYAALRLCEILSNNKLDMNNIFLKAGDFLRRLIDNNLSKGTPLLWDESGIDLNSKKWQNKANQVVNAVLQVFRKENLIVFFTLPYFSFLDSDARKLVHAVFETVGIDRERNEVIIKPKLVQVNQDTGKMYKKYLRVKANGNGLVPIENIRLKLPDAEKLKEYEDKKDVFAQALYKSAFDSVSSMDKPKEVTKPLTEKQSIVVEMLHQGKKQYEIAKELQISTCAISNIVKLARKKLGNELIIEN